MRSQFVISLFLSLCLTTIIMAKPQVEIETSIDMSGNLVTRCITPGSSVLPQEPASGIPNLVDQEIIWMTDDATAIPQNVALSGDGGYVVAGWWLNAERMSRYEVQGTGIPLWEYAQVPNFYMPVACSDDNNVIASTGDYIPMNVWLNGMGPDPAWTYERPPGYKGVYVDVSDNGMYIASLYTLEGGDTGKLILFPSTGPTPIWETDFLAETQVISVEISEDNSWVVVSTYNNYYVYDFVTMTLFATLGNYSQTPAGIDDDAEWIATGDFYGQLHVYQRNATGYTQQWQNYMGGWVTACDVSSDASTVMAGNFTYSPSNAGEVRAFDISGNMLWSYNQYGDYVDDVALCDDGSVGVAGSWGMLYATFGDVFTAFDIATGDVIFNILDDIDEPGSIFDVDISDDGSIAICGGKEVHARISGNGGQIYTMELGEAPVFTVDLTYVSGSPVPPGGGNVNYEIFCENVGSNPLDFDGWLDISYEGGVPATLAQRFFSAFQPGWTINRTDMYIPVPANYEPGNYTFYARAGDHPSTVIAEDSFDFVKSGDDGMTGFIPWAPDGMPNPFEDVVELTEAPSDYTVRVHPNPFNPSTAASFELPVSNHVNLSVYDVAGRKVAELVNGWRDAGYHEVMFDAIDLPSGVYVYYLAAGAFIAHGKMVLVK